MAHASRRSYQQIYRPRWSILEDFSACGNKYGGGSRFGHTGSKLMMEKKKAYGPEKEKKK